MLITIDTTVASVLTRHWQDHEVQLCNLKGGGMSIRRLQRHVLSVVAMTCFFVAGGTSAMAAQAGPEDLTDETAVAAPCGFYETASSAYYQHCGSTTVEIRVDYWEGSSGYECVGPWSTTYLGRAEDVDYAVYQHVGCP